MLYVFMYIEWLGDQWEPELKQLLNTHHIKFAGVALDNEATENAFFDILQDSFDFLIHVPCSAHIIQLMVKSILHPTSS
jgi:hypothetical protein